MTQPSGMPPIESNPTYCLVCHRQEPPSTPDQDLPTFRRLYRRAPKGQAFFAVGWLAEACLHTWLNSSYAEDYRQETS